MAKTPTPAAATRTVHLRESGQYLIITPPVKELPDVFFTARHQPIDMGAQGVWAVRRAEPLVWDATTSVETADPNAAGQTTLLSGIPAQQCFRGLAPLVEAELKRRGFRVRWVRKPLACLPEPAIANLIASGDDRTLPSFLCGRERGLIRYGRGVRVERLVVQLAAAWPDRQIVVVATRKGDVYDVHDAIAAAMPRVGRLLPGKAQPVGRRVVVATPAALALGPASVEHRDLYLALNPDELFSASLKQYAMQGIRHLWRARLFGFLPVGKRLPPLLRDHVRALFGTDECVVPAHGHTRRKVRVVFETVRRGPQPDATEGVYPVVRDAVHNSRLWNRMIRKLVCALTSGDNSKLKAEYPAVAALVAGRVRRTVVYVDNLGHGLRLARLMGLPVLADVVPESLLDPGDLALLNKGAEVLDQWQPVVVTTGGLQHLGFLDVVVRADGGTGRLPLPARHLMNRSGDDRDLVVIDFKDADVPLLRHRSRLRAEAYREAGWEVAGESSPSALELFKATRPEVFQ